MQKAAENPRGMMLCPLTLRSLVLPRLLEMHHSIRLRESGGLNTGKQVSLLLSTAGLKNSLLQWSQNS